MIRILTHRWFHFFFLAFLLFAAVYSSASHDRWRTEMQHFVFDSLNRMYPRTSTDQVVIVDIDDDSLKVVGQWPWSRLVVADLVTNLTALGAKVVAFDGVLAEPDRSSPRFMEAQLPDEDHFVELRSEIRKLPDHDTVLAEAIKNSGVFVSAFTFASYSQNPRKPRLAKKILVRSEDKNSFMRSVERFKATATFLPDLEAASAGNGSFMAFPDQDGVLRRTRLLFTDGQELYPSLSLEALRVSLGDKNIIRCR